MITQIRPFSFAIDWQSGKINTYHNLIQRRLSHMKGVFFDEAAWKAMLEIEDILIYEVYEIKVPDEDGHLMPCTSITYPGKIGNEFFMTKGHYHQNIQTAEIYYCLRGKGFMLMESGKGDWKAESMEKGKVLYVPPYYAHRSINTGQEPLISFCVYPGGAGHDYVTIEAKGFRKLLLEENGEIRIKDNPRWGKHL